MGKTVEERLAELTERVAELAAQNKQSQPTEREQVAQKLAEAKARKDFSAVVALSNELTGMKE